MEMLMLGHLMVAAMVCPSLCSCELFYNWYSTSSLEALQAWSPTTRP